MDDNLDLLLSVHDLLILDGVSVVHVAPTLREAERLLASGFHPSAVVLDLRLGGLRGEALIEQLRAHPVHRTVPIIAVSGDHAGLKRIEGQVARAFLKPVDPSVLLAALREVSAAVAPS